LGNTITFLNGRVAVNTKMFDNCRVPVVSFIPFEDIEEGAIVQLTNCSRLPFIFKQVVALPDVHFGKGICIGTVFATDGVILPHAVGSDIGCGMCAVKTSIKAERLDKDTLKKIMGKIREVIPVGFDHHAEKQPESFMPKFSDYFNRDPQSSIIYREYSSALTQLATLGSGNHFQEIQRDTEGFVWIMIHSGSRNLGYKVCEYYNKLAIELNERWHSSVPKEWELAFFPIESKEAKDYMAEMNYCVEFALANRKLMMDRIIQVLVNCGMFDQDFDGLQATRQSFINIAHNYARFENHFGKNVIVHRKGATSAREGEIGIIPGSQGSRSYIVKGLGNPKSFMSCSHGAGRKMGRNVAKKTLNLAEEIKKLDDQGIVHGIRNQNDLDEATGSYKDIAEVMKQQGDLVEILVELSPMGVIKG